MAYLFAGGHGLDQFIGERIRIAVQDADPLQIGDPVQVLQQVGQTQPVVQVDAVLGGILGHQDQFPHALAHQLPGFLQHFLIGTAAVGAPDFGNGAVGAPVVAPFGNFQIGRIPGGGQHPFGLLGICMGRFQQGEPFAGFHPVDDAADLVIAFGTDDGIHFRQVPEQVIGIPLSQASGDDQFPMGIVLLVFGHLQDRVDGFCLGTFDEAAGVHDDHIRMGGIVGDGPVALSDEPHHHFRIHQVLGTPQADYSDFQIVTPSICGRPLWAVPAGYDERAHPRGAPCLTLP